MKFVLGDSAAGILVAFIVSVTGYLLGAVHVKGISLGTAGVFLTGLLFGALGFHAPHVLETVGLILFVASVGLAAGPTFVHRMRQDGISYLILCLVVAATGALLCCALIFTTSLDGSLAVGLMTGAFTTSPGFAAAKEAVAGTPELVTRVAVGYGIGYPVGVLTKVLFIQVVPRWIGADMAEERKKIAVPEVQTGDRKQYHRLDPLGVSAFSLAVVLGILLGSIEISLPGGGVFSLGATGGPLITGLLLGHLNHIGGIDLLPDTRVCVTFKELGMVLFFAGAGLEGGAGLLEILGEYGPVLLWDTFLMAIIPMTAGFFLFRKVLKLPLLNGLGSLTASMTSTPSLAMLVQTAGTDDVAASYATTYPIAMVTLVLISQILVKLG